MFHTQIWRTLSGLSFFTVAFCSSRQLLELKEKSTHTHTNTLQQQIQPSDYINTSSICWNSPQVSLPPVCFICCVVVLQWCVFFSRPSCRYLATPEWIRWSGTGSQLILLLFYIVCSCWTLQSDQLEVLNGKRRHCQRRL